MKRSTNIQLVFLNSLILGAVACDNNAPPAIDPCNQRTFNQPACEMAIQNHGYHYHGAWIPFFYPSPYPFYLNGYNSYVARGGAVYAVPMSSYQQQYRSLDTRAMAYANVVTPHGTSLSPSRMSAITSRPASISSARSGATVSRGGFGSIGAGHATAGA